jgi:hypothetical protein
MHTTPVPTPMTVAQNRTKRLVREMTTPAYTTSTKA